MAWSYGGDPSVSPLDFIRFKLGDTNANSPLLQDEEIEYMLTESDNTLVVAANAADAIVAKLASQVDKSMGGTSVKASQRFDHYVQLAARLRNDVQKGIIAIPIAPQVGGAYIESRTTFSKGMHDGYPTHDVRR